MSGAARDDASRILFVSYTADWRGPTRSLVHLIDHLDERWRPSVALAGTGGFADALRERAVPRYGFEKLDKWSIPRLARIVRRSGIDVVYANATHGSARNAFLAAKLAGRPFVCHVRAMGWDKGWMRLGYLRFADAVIAVSQACAASVERFVPPERLHVVHNGVPLEDLQVRRSAAGTPDETRAFRDEIGAGPDEVVLLSVAHICRRKNQIDAVEAMPGILRQEPGARLVLAGATDREPEYTARVRELARRLDVSDRVDVLGFRTDVPELLAAADVFVHTAKADPHPRAVIEAMGAGLPVVGYRVDGVAETVVDGRTGRLVPPGDTDRLADAARDLAADADARQRMGSAARTRVREDFTAEATADRVGAILEQACGRSGARADAAA